MSRYKTPKTPHAFIALYTGDTIADARIVAASADTHLVTLAVRAMLAETGQRLSTSANPADAGKQFALQQIAQGLPVAEPDTAKEGGTPHASNA